MDKRLKTVLILGGIAIAVYLGYRWYQNRQSNAQGLGANLNSAAPELVAGSSGPSSGLNYYAGSTTVDITEPVTSTTKPKVGVIPNETSTIAPHVTGTVESVETPLATTQFGGTGATG